MLKRYDSLYATVGHELIRYFDADMGADSALHDYSDDHAIRTVERLLGPSRYRE